MGDDENVFVCIIHRMGSMSVQWCLQSQQKTHPRTSLLQHDNSTNSCKSKLSLICAPNHPRVGVFNPPPSPKRPKKTTLFIKMFPIVGIARCNRNETTRSINIHKKGWSREAAFERDWADCQCARHSCQVILLLTNILSSWYHHHHHNPHIDHQHHHRLIMSYCRTIIRH